MWCRCELWVEEGEVRKRQSNFDSVIGGMYVRRLCWLLRQPSKKWWTVKWKSCRERLRKLQATVWKIKHKLLLIGCFRPAPVTSPFTMLQHTRTSCSVYQSHPFWPATYPTDAGKICQTVVQKVQWSWWEAPMSYIKFFVLLNRKMEIRKRKLLPYFVDYIGARHRLRMIKNTSDVWANWAQFD